MSSVFFGLVCGKPPYWLTTHLNTATWEYREFF